MLLILAAATSWEFPTLCTCDDSPGISLQRGHLFKPHGTKSTGAVQHEKQTFDFHTYIHPERSEKQINLFRTTH